MPSVSKGDDLIVLLPRRIVMSIANERTKHLPNETGGFLIGRRRGPHIEVTDLTPQGPDDRATPTTFARLCASHRQRIHSAWRESAALETMVGDWHSHPSGPCSPSRTDRSAWRSLVRGNGLPMLGIIDAGKMMPGVFLTADSREAAGIELAPADNDVDAFFFTSSGRIG